MWGAGESTGQFKPVRDELGIACELPKRRWSTFTGLTQEVMVDPDKKLGDGYFYERKEALEKFFPENDKTSPVTGEKMPPLAPRSWCRLLKNQIAHRRVGAGAHRAYIDMHCALHGRPKEEMRQEA